MGVRERTHSKRKNSKPQRKMKIPLVLLVACVASLKAASLMDSVFDGPTCSDVCCPASTTTGGETTTAAAGETTTAAAAETTTEAAAETTTAAAPATTTAAAPATTTEAADARAETTTAAGGETTTVAGEGTTTACDCAAWDCDGDSGAGSASISLLALLLPAVFARLL